LNTIENEKKVRGCTAKDVNDQINNLKQKRDIELESAKNNTTLLKDLVEESNMVLDRIYQSITDRYLLLIYSRQRLRELLSSDLNYKEFLEYL
jgi:hypothetical protein